ncbi:MAG: DUF4494 domain-containing protein [Bacteroidaceae bacterium]|nr:DUF4494 domain-containing protein [Bacteroidaceae bacterium]
MRAKSAKWFECKARVAEMQDDGTAKNVTKQYVVESLSFTEAEEAMTEEMSALYTDFEITDIKKAAYSEIFFSDKVSDDNWFKVKLQYIILDDKTKKEKKTSVMHLVQAHTFSQAVEYVHQAMQGCMQDYTIHTIQETVIMDVFEHKAKKND